MHPFQDKFAFVKNRVQYNAGGKQRSLTHKPREDHTRDAKYDRFRHGAGQETGRQGHVAADQGALLSPHREKPRNVGRRGRIQGLYPGPMTRQRKELSRNRPREQRL